MSERDFDEIELSMDGENDDVANIVYEDTILD